MAMIGGPTGSGKTDLAMEIAKRRGWEILSADSGQSRRGLEVGTASPTGLQRRLVVHHLVGDLSPNDPDSVVGFLERARTVLSTPGADLLAVGGTGQYLEVLRRGLDAAPPPDPTLRAALELRLRAEGHQTLWEELQGICPDPPPDARQNPVRLLRAMEKAVLRSRGIEGHAHPALAPECPVFALRWPRELLHRRSAERMEDMFVRGWLEEVDILRASCPADAPAWKCIGFLPLREVLEGTQELSSAKSRIVEATRQYAKRQETFLRNRLSPHWIDGTLTVSEQADLLESLLA